jgi:hypothetical protein
VIRVTVKATHPHRWKAHNRLIFMRVLERNDRFAYCGLDIPTTLLAIALGNPGAFLLRCMSPEGPRWQHDAEMTTSGTTRRLDRRRSLLYALHHRDHARALAGQTQLVGHRIELSLP